MSTSVSAALAKAKLSEKEVPVCLYADAIEAYREAESVAAEAAKNSLSGTVTIPQELVDAVEAATIRLTLRAHDRLAWRELLKAHPPRKDNMVDRQLGFNEETFYPALVRVSVVSPDITDQEWEQLDRCLTEGEWNRLVNAAQSLNLKVSQLPF